jgi:hypothetical protein
MKQILHELGEVLLFLYEFLRKDAVHKQNIPNLDTLLFEILADYSNRRVILVVNFLIR